jgi:hypothetical protein
MYLCIYKKKNKLYFSTVNKLTEKVAFTNPEFQSVIVGYKQKIDSYKINSLDDLARIMPELKAKYAGRIYILENKYQDKTQIKVVIFLLGNPFYELGLFEREEANDVEEGKCSTRTIQIENNGDWLQAENEFDFKADIGYYDLVKEN